MKKFILVFFFLFLNNALAQPFLPMLEEDHVWGTDFFVDPFGGGQTGIISSENFVADETIINNETYKSVYINGVLGSCLVREEDGFVYRYDVDTAQEYVIYNFNLNIGEVFSIPDVMYSSFCSSVEFYNGIDEMTVTDKTTEFIAGENRLVITFDYFSESGFECKWIEGIGSTLGFDPVGDIIDIGSRYLVCFTKNGITYFFNNATACDNTTLNVPENLQNQIVMAPNPVQDVSILQLPWELKIDTVRIYDIQGRLVSEEKISKNYLNINVMDYASGVYFYQVIRGKISLKTDRFIVK